MHPTNRCPTFGQQCYACGGSNHYTAPVSRNTGDTSSTVMIHEEVNTTPGEVPADTEADAPAGLPAGHHATTIAKAVAPLIALPIALAIAHCPASLNEPITGKPP